MTFTLHENTQLVANSKRLPRAILIVALALICLALRSQTATGLDNRRALTQAFLRIWQLQQGLPRATIFAIRQTSDGYIWLATQDGLVRFDGIRFVPMPERNGIQFDKLWAMDLVEDAQQNVWVATIGQGLVRVRDDHGARQYTMKDGLPSDDVRALAPTKSGLWITTPNGVALVGDKIVSFGMDQGLATNDVWAVCEAPDGKVYFGGEGGELSIWDGKSFTVQSLKSIPNKSLVRALLAREDGSIWVGTDNGLVKLKDNQERLFTVGDGLADDTVLSLAAGSEDCLWIGTKEGFSRMVGGKFESFRTDEGLSQSTVLAMLEDREGSLWVGTKHGLNQFTDRRAVIFTTREGLPSNDIGPVLQDSQGKIWVGTLGAGLSSYDGERFVTLTTLSDGLPSDRIYALAESADGVLWVGTDRGLSRVRNGKVEATFTRNEGLPSDFILCLLSDHKSQIWAGTSQGVAMLRDGRFEQPKGDSDALSIPIHSLVEQRDQTLLLAGGDGRLFRYANDELRAFRPDGLPPDDVSALHVDGHGMLWLGTTDKGLFLVDGSKLRHFETKDGLFDDEIFAIVSDEHDRLWMACGRGVFYVSRDQLMAYEPGKSKPLESSPFTPTDSSRTIECRGGVRPAMWTMKDGSIWCSTVRGVIVIDPQRINRVLPPTPLVVDEVLVNGRYFSPDKISDSLVGNTNVEFRYAALSFVAPTRTTYQYKLDGFDKDWVDAGARREAFYTNLPPGTYQFHVRCRTFNGDFGEAQSFPPFTVLPHFYQRTWFFPLCAILIGLSGWGLYRMRVRRIKDQMRAVVSERSRIARELHDTLIQGFSGVTMQMQALATRLPTNDERENLQEIIRDAGVCLRDARRSVAGLRREPEGQSSLATAITHAAKQLTETHDVHLNLHVRRDLPALPLDVEYNLLRIAQEAILNSIKHSGANTIEVSLERAADEIQLAITDDGNGFMESGGNGAALGHYGLVGMRERAMQIGADFNLDSEPGRGTRISVNMPILRSEQIAN